MAQHHKRLSQSAQLAWRQRQKVPRVWPKRGNWPLWDTLKFRRRIKHVKSPRRMAQQSSCQMPRWGQKISPVVGDLFQYETAACACLVWGHTAYYYYYSPHVLLKQVHWGGRPSDISCLSVSCETLLSCDVVMWWTALVHPKISLTKCPTWQKNCIDLVPSFQYYNQNSHASVSASWLLTGIIYLFLWGHMKAEVITLVPGLQTPEEK